jgi:sporulation protein YlmC with PRC-barrel domain
MKQIWLLSVGALMAATAAQAQTTAPADQPSTDMPAASSTTTGAPTPSAAAPMGSAAAVAPNSGTTVTNWYKQSVYDGTNSKVGDIQDVLVADNGQVTGFVISVGGFLGIGDKDVIVPFNAIKHEMRDSKPILTTAASKDSLKAAPGYKYDRTSTTWVPDQKG